MYIFVSHRPGNTGNTGAQSCLQPQTFCACDFAAASLGHVASDQSEIKQFLQANNFKDFVLKNGDISVSKLPSLVTLPLRLSASRFMRWISS